MKILKQLTSILFEKPYCESCGEELEEAIGWRDEYSCPKGCHPDNYNRGGLIS